MRGVLCLPCRRGWEGNSAAAVAGNRQTIASSTRPPPGDGRFRAAAGQAGRPAAPAGTRRANPRRAAPRAAPKRPRRQRRRPSGIRQDHRSRPVGGDRRTAVRLALAGPAGQRPGAPPDLRGGGAQRRWCRGAERLQGDLERLALEQGSPPPRRGARVPPGAARARPRRRARAGEPRLPGRAGRASPSRAERLADRLLGADGGAPRVPEAARRWRAARARACRPSRSTTRRRMLSLPPPAPM